MYMCVRCVDLAFFYDFLFDFGTVQNILFFILLLENQSYQKMLK
jgi:hypothetical protein